MKNIHILPTDKPSRLYLGKNGNFVFGIIKNSIQSKNNDFTNQNIYITSDEEIKEGEYGLSRLGEICKFHSGYDYRYYAKIILTTDQDLIKDGVQAIDDEFLEWFVKNSSCEEVEIISLEKRIGSYDGKGSVPLYVNIYGLVIPKEEPKQETLEEYAERIAKANGSNNWKEIMEGIIEGAKWQQERSYSEGEVILLLQKSITHQDDGETGSLVTAQGKIRTANFYSWFEKYKKK